MKYCLTFFLFLTINCDKRDVDFLPEPLTNHYDNTLYNPNSFDLKHFEQTEGKYYVLYAESSKEGIRMWVDSFTLKGVLIEQKPFDVRSEFD